MIDTLKAFLDVETNYELVWIAVGFGAQALFMMRFLVQWIASERARRSVMPVAFWYFSVGGGALLLAYAIHRSDPVFIAGQAGGLVVYLRNLYFIHRHRLRDEDADQVSEPADTTSNGDPTVSRRTESAPP